MKVCVCACVYESVCLWVSVNESVCEYVFESEHVSMSVWVCLSVYSTGKLNSEPHVS